MAVGDRNPAKFAPIRHFLQGTPNREIVPLSNIGNTLVLFPVVEILYRRAPFQTAVAALVVVVFQVAAEGYRRAGEEFQPRKRKVRELPGRRHPRSSPERRRTRTQQTKQPAGVDKADAAARGSHCDKGVDVWVFQSGASRPAPLPGLSPP